MIKGYSVLREFSWTENYKLIIWFNSLFLKNDSNNIGKYFLLLIQKHFPNNHKYHKIFYKNNVNISCSCIANIKSIINIHNNEVITEKKIESAKCNCINIPDCSLFKQCQITNIIYKAKIISDLLRPKLSWISILQNQRMYI